MDVYEEADLYCGAFSWPLDAEVEFLLSLAPGAKSVLEPFCGNARYAPLFVDRGLEYHGVDLSQAMLDRAPRGPGVTLHRADVRSFDLGRTFDLAFTPVNSIRHLLAERDVLDHLACMRRHLASRGRYVVELELVRTDGPWPWRPEHGGEWVQPQPDGTEVHARWRRERCDLADRTCVERATFRHVAGGRVRETAEHVYTMRLWTYDDLERLLRASGFRVAAVHGHDSDVSFPAVALSRAAENDGVNRYYVLVPA